MELVSAAATNTTSTCHSQRIENNERAKIVKTAHECKQYKYENRDDIPINGKVPRKYGSLSSHRRYIV